MGNSLNQFLDSSGFMPHGHCFLWTPSLLWSYVVADTLIAVSYYSIPFALWYLARKRQDLPYRRVFILFGIFVMACGTTHFFAVLNIWQPDYWADAAIKIFAAVMSVITAIALWRLMPEALAIPSRREIVRLNLELQNEITRRRQVESELLTLNQQLEVHVSERSEELKYKNILLETQQETSLDGVLLVDQDSKILSYNRQFIDMFHLSQELIRTGKDEPVLEFVTEQVDHPDAFLDRIKYLYAHPAAKSSDEVRLKDGRSIDRYSAPVTGADGHCYGRVWYFRDITERKQAEQVLERTNRALRTLSACNEALVHADNEIDLLDAICRIIVEKGGYRMAWVGFPEHDLVKSVRPVAHYGDEYGYLASVEISWADTATGRGPAGTAIRSGEIQISHSSQDNPAVEPWREELIKHGFLSSITLPLKNSVGTLGILAIYATTTNAFDEAEVRLLRELAEDLAFGIETLRARYDHLHHQDQLRQSLEDSVKAIAATVEARDPYTSGHQSRVAQLASAIAREMKLPEESIRGIEIAASIHDLGKISIPAEILSKPGRLTNIEQALVRQHAQSGYDILKDIKYPWPIATMVLQHHERIDGSGYPQGLRGDQILLGSRILAVADVVESMSSHRPYRPALGIEAAMREIEHGRSTLYDAGVVDACLKLFHEGKFTLQE